VLLFVVLSDVLCCTMLCCAQQLFLRAFQDWSNWTNVRQREVVVD
jgi:hypothetical protein